MGSEWREVQIKDLGRVVTGRTPPLNDPEYYGSEMPFLTPSDMGDFRCAVYTARSLSAHGADRLSRCIIPRGVGVSCIGWQMGKSILIDRPTVTNQQVNSIIVDERIADYHFVYYSLRARRNEIFNLGAGGSRTPILNKSDFERLPFSLPSLPQQYAIAGILGALDDKIEANHRMNETLEALARAIYKEWFVDFGPVRASARGQKSPGLSTNTSALFPNRFTEQEQPEGWGWRKLGEVTSEIRRGISPSYVADGGVLVLNQKCIRGRRVSTEKARRHDCKKKSVDGRSLICGDILINSTGVGTLGRVAQVWLLPEPITIVDSHVTVVRAKEDVVLPSYLGFNLTSREREIESMGEGSTGQTELARTRLSELNVLLPSRATQEAFDQLTKPLVEKIVSNDAESCTLASLRDLLLPKLMSGELQVRAAEKVVASAL